MKRKTTLITALLIFIFFGLFSLGSIIQDNKGSLIIDLTSSSNDATYSLNSFNDSDTAKNVTGSDSWSDIVYLNIPKDADVTSAYINVTGFNDTNDNYPFNPALDVGNDGSGEWDYTKNVSLGEHNNKLLEDTYVNESNPMSSYGSENNMYANDVYSSIVKFNISQISGEVISSNLTLNPHFSSQDCPIYFYRINNQTWTEDISYSTKPEIGELLFSQDFDGQTTATKDYFFDEKLDNFINDMQNSSYSSVSLYYNSDCFTSNWVTKEEGGFDASVLKVKYKGKYYKEEKTISLSSSINSYLSTCTADANGNCNVPINISATNGTLQLDNININYGYNTTNLFTVSDYKWDSYSELIANQDYNKTKYVNNTGTVAPQDVNVSGYNISGTSCEVDDSSKEVEGIFYQEFTNVSDTDTQQTSTDQDPPTDTNPSLMNYSGNYAIESSDHGTNLNNVFDGNWSTNAYDDSTTENYIYMNYSKPNNTISAKWKVKDGGGTTELNIPSDCWSYYPNKIELKVLLHNSFGRYNRWKCFNGTWVTLRSTSNFENEGVVYEEAINWYRNKIVCNYSHQVTQGSTYPDFEFWESSYPTGTPINQTETQWFKDGVDYDKNVTLNYYSPDETLVPAGTFTNATTTQLCMNDSVVHNEKLEVEISGTRYDITPSSAGNYEKKEPVVGYIYYVKKGDLCGNGNTDFKVKVESNN